MAEGTDQHRSRLDYDTPPEVRPHRVLDLNAPEPSPDEFGPWLPISRPLQRVWFVVAWSVYVIVAILLLAVVLAVFRGCQAVFA